MVPTALYRLLRCPTCTSRDLVVETAGVRCLRCQTAYPQYDGYLDLMPRGIEFGYVSKYVAEESELAEELDYRDLAPLLLAAGVRDRTMRRLLKLNHSDIVLDNGCGNGRFAFWNAQYVKLMIGSDPATLFADQALASIALAQADSRRLPFADNSIDKAFSLDVLEHFPSDVIDAYLAETARVLKPGGRLLIFSNTRERSPLQPLIDLSRRLGRLFVRAGLYDFEREARRKSDHIKALEHWEAVLAAVGRAGLQPVRAVFWNSLFTTFVEHVLMKLGESLLGRQRSSTTKAEQAQGAGTQREILARRRMRGRLNRRGPTFYALLLVTLLMELDVRLFGWLRCGSYFLLVEKER